MHVAVFWVLAAVVGGVVFISFVRGGWVGRLRSLAAGGLRPVAACAARIGAALRRCYGMPAGRGRTGCAAVRLLVCPPLLAAGGFQMRLWAGLRRLAVCAARICAAWRRGFWDVRGVRVGRLRRVAVFSLPPPLAAGGFRMHPWTGARPVAACAARICAALRRGFWDARGVRVGRLRRVAVFSLPPPLAAGGFQMRLWAGLRRLAVCAARIETRVGRLRRVAVFSLPPPLAAGGFQMHPWTGARPVAACAARIETRVGRLRRVAVFSLPPPLAAGGFQMHPWTGARPVAACAARICAALRRILLDVRVGRVGRLRRLAAFGLPAAVGGGGFLLRLWAGVRRLAALSLRRRWRRCFRMHPWTGALPIHAYRGFFGMSAGGGWAGCAALRFLVCPPSLVVGGFCCFLIKEVR